MFADFWKHYDELKLFSDPFRIDVNDAYALFQLELIDMLSDSDLKRAYAEHDLLRFYRQYVTSVSYPNLSQHALRFIALFCSTYCCEQFFSRMKIVNAM